MTWWKNWPWRLIQTNLREIDMRDISAERYVEDLKSFGATVAMINAAGIIASYPTSLPFHTQSEHLQADSLETIVKLCHDNDIKVIARTDFSKVRRPLFNQHPEWAFRTSEGEIVDYNGDVQVCINGEYQQRYAFEILSEMFETIPFDGLYCNMGGFLTRDYDLNEYGFCHCQSCQDGFKAYSGFALPEKVDYSNPVYTTYLEFQQSVLKAHRHKTRNFLRSISPDICFDEVDYSRIEAATEYRKETHPWPYQAASNCRVTTGDRSSDIICSNTSVDFLGFSHRHVSVSAPLQKLRLWQNIANFGALDYYLIGRIDSHLDQSAFDSVKEVFAFHHQHQDLLRSLKPCARVILVRAHRWIASAEEKGWIEAMTQSHIPFMELLEQDLPEVSLQSDQIVILPDLKYISLANSKQIDLFVKNGGKLIVTGETGLYDSQRGQRSQNLFECLGVGRCQSIDNSMVSALLLINHNESSVWGRLAKTTVIPLGDSYVNYQTRDKAKNYLSLIPPHKYGPPERCYFDKISQEYCGIVEYKYGKGISYCLPWKPGTVQTAIGFQNHTAELMQDLLTELCRADMIKGNIHPMVETTLAVTSDNQLLLHLVNTGGFFNSSCFTPPVFYNVKAGIRLNQRPAAVRKLSDSKDLDYSYDGSLVWISLPELNEYEGILISKQH